jgi:hypothetical protein
MRIRRPLYGNIFWYADEGRLRAIVTSAIEDATPAKISGEIRALIVPHGTHLKCGPIAGYAYKLLLTTTQSWDGVTLLAPQLREGGNTGNTLQIDEAEAYLTPLDAVQVDRALLARLRTSGVAIEDAADDEPIIESQLPFVQTALGDVPVLPLRIPSSPSKGEAGRGLIDQESELGLIIAAGNLPEGNEKAVADAIVRMDVAALRGDLTPGLSPRGEGRLRSLFTRAKPIAPNPDLTTIALALDLARGRGATHVKQLFVAGQFGAFVVFGD